MSVKPVKTLPPKPQCLVCGEHSSSKNPLRRGLCAKHYAQFKKMRNMIPPENVETFEKRLIDDGKLLPDRQGQKGDGNQFLEYARDLLPDAARAISDSAKHDTTNRKRKERE
jgi:hypothetical protein